MKPLVLYHGNCTDGFGAAYAAWVCLGDSAEYKPMNYGDALPAVDELLGRTVYVLDFSFSREVMENLFRIAESVTWLDHHKTAFEAFGQDPTQRWDAEEPGVTIRLHNDQSGALIAWEYFQGTRDVPALIRHIDDRDRWQFQIHRTREVHEGLQALKPWSFWQWDRLASSADGVHDLKRTGETLLKARDLRITELVSHAGDCLLFDGAKEVGGLAVNAGPDVASELGNQLAKASGTYGMVWHVGRDHKINCSLRSIGDFDVSAIAKEWGGGGHKNAAGFRLNSFELLADFLGASA